MDTLTINKGAEEWGEEEIIIPAKRAMCARCEGKGTHVNPGIDDNGLSQECMEDRDFMDDYIGGVYDVRCHECKGERIVLVPDWERMTEEQRKAWTNEQQEWAELRADEEAERRMGA